MNFMPQIAQTFGGLKQISLGTALEIEAFMNEGYLHEMKAAAVVKN